MKPRSILVTGGLGLIMMLSLLLGTGATVAEEAPPLEGEGQFIKVVVQPGDSLAKYAPAYGVSGSAMLAVNNLRNPDILYPGQTIIIPVIKTRTPSLTTPFYYTVQAGDTLTSIGKEFHIDADVIAFANGTVGDTVILGKTYLIPAGPHREYVKRGEHLGIIAARYNVTLDFLLRANPSVANPSQLLIGQRINIPIIYDAKPIPITETPLAFVPETPTATPTATTTAVVFPTRTPKPTATSIAASNNFITVVVQFNESLLTYALRYGVSGSAILAVNPKLQVNPDLIFPGDIVTIPVVVSFTPSRSTPFFYTVQPGDTAITIANRFEMTSDTLIAANPRASFAADTTLLVPAGPHVYIAQPGDTLATIGAKYLVSVDFLLRANPSIPSPDVIFAGQRIFIPLRIDASPVPFN